MTTSDANWGAAYWHPQLDATGAAVCLMDVEGRVHRCNEALCHLACKPSGAIVGTLCWEATGCALKRNAECPARHASATRRRQQTVHCVAGRRYEITVEPLLDAQGELVGALHSMTDISRREPVAPTPDDDPESERLRTIGLLMSVVAHDFNNLLTGVIGHATLAKGRLPRDSEVHENLDEILAAARDASEAANEVIAFARNETATPRNLNLSKLVSQVIHLLAPRIPRTVRMNCRLADHLPEFSAVPTQIRRVVMNLVLNAAQAAEATEGSVSVTTSLVPDPAVLPDAPDAGLAGRPCVGLEILDTGPGIEEAALAHLSEPFFTLKKNGRGLGLTGVREIIRRHNGAFHIARGNPSGTRVRVLLPACNLPTAAA